MSGPRPPWQSGSPPGGLLPRPQVAGPGSQQRPLINASKCGDRPLRKTAPEARRCVFSASASGPGLPWSGARGPPPATGAAWLPLRGARGGGRQGRAGVRAGQPAAAAALHARPRLRMCPGVGGQRGVGPGPLQGEAGRSEAARRGLPAPPAPALSRVRGPSATRSAAGGPPKHRAPLAGPLPLCPDPGPHLLGLHRRPESRAASSARAGGGVTSWGGALESGGRAGLDPRARSPSPTEPRLEDTRPREGPARHPFIPPRLGPGSFSETRAEPAPTAKPSPLSAELRGKS